MNHLSTNIPNFRSIELQNESFLDTVQCTKMSTEKKIKIINIIIKLTLNKIDPYFILNLKQS